MHALAKYKGNSLKRLIEKFINEFKCDPDSADLNGKTPLMVAASCDNYVFIRTLLDEYNCKADAKSNDGRGLIHFAVKGKHLKHLKSKNLKFLLKYGLEDQLN